MRLRVRAWLRLRVEVGVRVRVWLRLYKLINKTLFKVLFSDDIFSGFWAPRATHPQSPPRARPRRPTHRPQSRSYAEYPSSGPAVLRKVLLDPLRGSRREYVHTNTGLHRPPTTNEDPTSQRQLQPGTKIKKARAGCACFTDQHISRFILSPPKLRLNVYSNTSSRHPRQRHTGRGAQSTRNSLNNFSARRTTHNAHTCGRTAATRLATGRYRVYRYRTPRRPRSALGGRRQGNCHYRGRDLSVFFARERDFRFRGVVRQSSETS